MKSFGLSFIVRTEIFLCVLVARTYRALPCAMGPNQDRACCKMFSQGTNLQIMLTNPLLHWSCSKHRVNHVDVGIGAPRKNNNGSSRPTCIKSTHYTELNCAVNHHVVQTERFVPQMCVVCVNRKIVVYATQGVNYEDQTSIHFIRTDHIKQLRVLQFTTDIRVMVQKKGTIRRKTKKQTNKHGAQ